MHVFPAGEKPVRWISQERRLLPSLTMTHMVEDENQKSQRFSSYLYMGTMACVHPHAQTHIINIKNVEDT